MQIAVKFSMALCLSVVFPLALAVTPEEQAFLDGQAIAQSAKLGTSANVTNGAIANTVNGFNSSYYQYSTTAPEAGLFAGGNGDTLSAGSNKITSCQTGTANQNVFLQQNCNAINFMAGNTARRPQFTINSNDPLLVNSRSIQNNAGTLAAQSLGYASSSAIGGFTGCQTTTTTTATTYTTEVCNDAVPATSQVCPVGRTIVVDAYSNFQCNETSHAYETQNCNRTLNAVVTPTPYCDVAGAYTLTGGATIPAAFYDVVFSCAGSSLAQVTVSINPSSQCHGGSCNSSYYPMTMYFTPGVNATATANLAQNYTGSWWYTTTLTYDGATRLLSLSTPVSMYWTYSSKTGSVFQHATASTPYTGTCGTKYVKSSSWINGCATQQAAAL